MLPHVPLTSFIPRLSSHKLTKYENMVSGNEAILGYFFAI